MKDFSIKPSLPIGIITGSGPQAGIDLWAKINLAAVNMLGENFRGDLDYPNVTVFSIPELGLSMEIDQFEGVVYKSLFTAVERISRHVGAYAIACNTLNYFAQSMQRAFPDCFLVSYSDCLTSYLRRNEIKDIALLGAAPVLDLTGKSTFSNLKSDRSVELPHSAQECQELIYNIKRFGSDNKNCLNQAFELIDTFKSDHVVLACTEFSSLDISQYHGEKTIIDISNLVAEKLVEIALCSTDKSSTTH